MTRPPRILSLVLCLAFAACGGAEDGGEAATGGSDWEHATTTEGDVTTVHTTSGSVWGGEAMVSEEMSIGQLEGADEYAFAYVSEVWVDGAEVYVADGRLPAVRVFDTAGNFLREIGGPGQGPGEYENAQGVATLSDGRIVVYDGVKLLVYEADGTYVEQWGREASGGFRFSGPDMTAVGEDGTIYVRTPIMPEERTGFSFGSMNWAMTPYALDGTVGEMLEVPLGDFQRETVEVTIGTSRASMPVPFAPAQVWTMLPDGSFAVGVSDSYSFEIHHPDGTRTRVVKDYEPVPIDPGEITLQQRSVRIVINGQTPEMDWSGMEPPEHKPAYDSFIATQDNRLLVLRSGPATVDPACLEPDITSQDIQAMDCTDGVTWGDLFEADGTFLGTFEVPDGVNLRGGVWIDGHTIWAPAQDDLGTVMVKQLRITPPGQMPVT